MIIVILGFAYASLKRWLKHKEKMEEQYTIRYRKTVEGIADIMKSYNLSKGFRAIAGKKEQIESFNRMGSSVDKMLDAYMDLTTAQVMNEFDNMSFEERTPVREVKKDKRIYFPRKKKRSRRKSE